MRRGQRRRRKGRSAGSMVRREAASVTEVSMMAFLGKGWDNEYIGPSRVECDFNRR